MPLFSFCQNRPFEIFGTLTGNYDGKVYLFFEGKVRVNERFSAEIKNGMFYFKGSAPMPILAKVALENSLICDFYIDNSHTYLKCATNIQVYNQGKDTLNLFSVTSVSGSGTDKLKSDFEANLKKLNKSKVSDEVKSDAYYKKLSALIRSHPNSKVSPYLLGKASTLSYSQVKQLSVLIDTSLNKSYEAKSVTSLLNELDKSKNSAIGRAFKDIILKDSSDQEVDTKQFRGKYTLIVFWASWCKPCRAEHPDLNILYSRYKDQGFDMLGISLDDDIEKWKKAILKDQLRWIQVIDPNAFKGEVARYYDIQAIPANILIDKTGKIIGASLTTKEIEATIEKVN
jgi:thiol-disulfide isomerase/thioredoxin